MHNNRDSLNKNGYVRTKNSDIKSAEDISFSYLRSHVCANGDIRLLQAINFEPIANNERYLLPKTPRPCRLSTPSTMSRLFPDSTDNLAQKNSNGHTSCKSNNSRLLTIQPNKNINRVSVQERLKEPVHISFM